MAGGRGSLPRLLAVCACAPALARASCGKAPTYTQKPDTDFPGCDLPGSKATPSAEECAQLCVSTAGCQGASWNGPDSQYHDNNCNLKSCSGAAAARGLVGIAVDRGSMPAGLPAEWCEAYEQADLLFTQSEQDVKYHPEVGNGFVATEVGSDDMFAAGVFNGPAVSDNPSHRARIPAPLKLAVDGAAVGAGLHLRSGAYLRRYTVGTATVELRFYAHRARRSLMVVDVTTDSQQGVEVGLSGFGGAAPSSDDFVWTASQITAAGKSALVWAGETREAETADQPTTRVSVVLHTAPSGPVTVSKRTPISFVAAVRTSLESEDPEADAEEDWKQAVQKGADALYSEHTAAWARLWESGVEITGRMDVARVVNSSQYYLLSSLRADAPYSTSPGGLAHGKTHRGYLGHTFWDAETWMYPPLVLWHPDIAASMLEYRLNTVPEAEKKAQGYGKGWKGAMFAWESAATGAETCPTQYPEGELEQHITGDIALAAQQLWYATHNKSWLAHAAEGLVLKTADFWKSRVEWDGDAANIKNVIPPDESADHGVDNSVFTNFVAKRNLLFAEEASRVLDKEPDADWRKTADAIVMNYDASKGIHPEYQGYDGGQIKQADVVLLGYPLTMNMSLEDRRKDLEFYAPQTDPDAPCMSWSMYIVGYLDVGDMAGAANNFEHSFANSHAPFYVWTEQPDSGCVGFLTGLGGFLQTVLFGFGGVRIWRDHLALNPSLISDMSHIVLRGVHFRGAVLQISFDEDEMEVLAVDAPGVVHVTDASGGTKSITGGQTAKMPRGRAKITVSENHMPLNEFRLLAV